MYQALYMKIFYLISVLVFSTCILQGQSGEVIYSIRFNSENDSITKKLDNPSLKEKVDEIATRLQLKLKFNQAKSQFGLVKNLFLNDNDFSVRAAKRLYGGGGRYFTDLTERYSIEEKEFLGKPFNVKTKLDEIEWVLTNESKIISGYNCFKAVGVRYSTDRQFNRKEYNVYAWYSPEIPINFGPFEAVGLPGLVLQFDLIGRSLVADKIDFNKEVIVESAKNNTIISKQEFDNIVQKRVEREIRN